MFIELPDNVIAIPIGSAVLDLLEIYGIDYTGWGKPGTRTKPVIKLIKEIIDDEAVIAPGVRIINDQSSHVILKRFIKTVTTRITCDVPTPTLENPNLVTRFLLEEFTLADGKLEPREFDNSLSEKLQWRLEGDNTLLTLKRAFLQEMGLKVKDEHLLPPYLLPVSAKQWDFEKKLRNKLDPRGFEIDLHESTKFPGLWTQNYLFHYFWQMPIRYFYPEGYSDCETGNEFRWKKLGPVFASQMTKSPDA